jgi:hypothetical protein
MDRPLSSRDMLHNRIKKKKQLRSKQNTESKTGIDALDNEDTDIFQMISQVQNILRTNPEMVSKVSNCVNSLMSNSDIMNQLSSQIQNIQSQTLETSTSGVNEEAVSKKS